MVTSGAHSSPHTLGNRTLLLAVLQHLRLHHVLQGAASITSAIVLGLFLAASAARSVDQHVIAARCHA